MSQHDRRLLFSSLLLMLLAIGLAHRIARPVIAGTTFGSLLVTMTVLRDSGGRVDWSHAHNLIAFDALGLDDFYDVYLMTPDGLTEACLTCNTSQLPNKHIGNPAWHPNGQFLAIQVDKAEHSGDPQAATPGLGINNDIWIINRYATIAFQITNVAEGMGVLHPDFSCDWSKLVWSERVSEEPGPSGEWVLRVLEFSDSVHALRQPSISTYQPFGPMFYESHGFAPDGSSIVFTVRAAPDLAANSWLDIYTMELTTAVTTPLTFTLRAWDEHAQFSPSGTGYFGQVACTVTAIPLNRKGYTRTTG